MIRIRSKIFRGFFISYLIILVFMLVFSSLLLSYMLRDKENAMLADLQYNFSSSCDHFNQNTAGSFRTLVSICFDKKVKDSFDRTSDDPVFRDNISSIINEIFHPNKTSFSEYKPFLYFRKADVVLSSKGTCGLQTFCSTYFSETEKVRNILFNSENKRFYAQLFSIPEGILYYSTLPLIPFNEIAGFSGFLIPYSVFETLIPQIYINPAEVGLILQNPENGEVLYSKGMGCGDYPVTGKVSENSYLLSSLLPDCRIKVSLLFPASSLLDANTTVRNYTVTFLLAALAGGLILCFVFSLRNYHPIRKIACLAGVKSNNELASIEITLSSLQNARNELYQQLATYHSEQLDSGLSAILLENGKEPERFLQAGGLAFPLVIISLSYVPETDRSALRDFLETRLGQFGPARLVVCQNTLAALWQIENTAKACDLFENVTSAVEQLFQFTLTVGISHPAHDCRQIGEAYREARHIVDYASLLGVSGVYSMDALSSREDQQETVSLVDYMHLQRAIRNGSFNEANRIFDYIVNVSFTQGIPLSLLRCRFLGLVNTLELSLASMPGSQQYNQIVVPDELLSCTSVPDLIRVTKTILQQIQTIFEKKENEKKQNQKESISDYIEEHHADPNLTVASIAEHFGIHPANISRIFNDSENSILDLIHGARIRHAQSLLCSTNDSVRSIALAVGYTNEQTFFRTFKKYVGVSPTNYRSEQPPK